MADEKILNYEIHDPIELNLSYMPFIINGGLFIPTQESFELGDAVIIDLTLPAKKGMCSIEGKVVWVIAKNALHHVLAGVGVQFTGANSKEIRALLEANLDTTIEVGGYSYGITDTNKT